jgi:hypothetical protein
MQIPVLIEPIAGNGFRAKSGEPLALMADGPTREEALRSLRQLLHQRLQNGAELASVDLGVTKAENPWCEFAGMFKDDPYFDEWQEAIAENRRKADEDADIP